MHNDISGGLSLANLFQAAGLVPEDVQVIRHTLKPDGLKTRADAIGPSLLPYVREQGIRNSKLPATPPRIWLNFLATTGRRARFLTAYENHGEVLAERADLRRFLTSGPPRCSLPWPTDWSSSGRRTGELGKDRRPGSHHDGC